MQKFQLLTAPSYLQQQYLIDHVIVKNVFCKSTRKKDIAHIDREKEIPPGMYIAFNSQCSRRRSKNLIFL